MSGNRDAWGRVIPQNPRTTPTRITKEELMSREPVATDPGPYIAPALPPA